MNESQISVRYAKAFFSLAKNKNKLDEVYQDLGSVLEVFKNSNDLKKAFESPIVNTSKKIEILTEIFKKHITELTFNFLKTIFENKREMFLDLVLLNVLHYCKQEKGIRTALLTTAVPVSESIKGELRNKINNSYQCTTELSEKIDDGIIGGFILQLDDMQYNASFKQQLSKLKNNLISGV